MTTNNVPHNRDYCDDQNDVNQSANNFLEKYKAEQPDDEENDADR